MSLKLKEKQVITSEISKRYQKARKKGKINILTEFCNLTKYNRTYASFILRSWGKKLFLRRKGTLIVYVAGETKKLKRYKPKIYDNKVITVLKKIWYICDCICGKRLASILKETVSVLEKYKEITLDDKTRNLLFKISPATIDRALKEERKLFTLKTKGRTRPGTLLKHQIPIRTFSEWNEKKPGFVEIDLVSHNGGEIHGDFIQTLDLTDIATTWTETQAVINKAQIWVFKALEDRINQLPFKILGIDSDNGSEFINNHLLRFCLKEKITFTRTRPYRKNDNCFVEQKNYSIVRRYAGYYRYDTPEELNFLNELYKFLRLYTNFFLPTMKLTSKTRIGSKVTRKYDSPKTPYQRVLESSFVDEENKKKLKSLYKTLNPAELKRQIENLQDKLLKCVRMKMKGNDKKYTLK